VRIGTSGHDHAASAMRKRMTANLIADVGQSARRANIEAVRAKVHALLPLPGLRLHLYNVFNH
jgi:hypothetical protein